MVAPIIISIFLTLVQAVASSSCDFSENNCNDKYFRLTAKKLRGKTLNDAVSASEAKHVLVERDNGDGYVSIDLVNENTFYLTEIEIGSPAQKVGVLVDTGSSDLWVVASNNTYCKSGTTGPLSSKGRSFDDIYDWNNALSDNTSSLDNGNFQMKAISDSSAETIDCSVYGTFDPNDSDTFRSNGTSFAITYADNTFAKGTWSHDDVLIGGVNVESLSFAVCDTADNALGILGIGLQQLETTYSGTQSTSLSNRYVYENLPVRLKTLGFIELVSYSVYLNDTTADSAVLLFGAVDHSKYTGDLVALPIVNTLAAKGYKNAIELTVTLNSITLIDSKSSKQAIIGSGASAALLDTGTTLSYMPSDILSNILNLINAEYSSSIGYYIVTCRDVTDFSLNFNMQGFNINIALSEFLVPLSTSSGLTSKYCMVGISSSDNSNFVLGDNFLRNVYMVADYENMEVALAVANHDANSPDDIEVMSTGIPNAVTPASSLMYGQSSGTSLVVTASVMGMSAIPNSQTSYTMQTNSSSKQATTTRLTSTNGNTAATIRTSTLSNPVSSISSITSASRNQGNLIEMNGLALLGGIFALFSALL